MFAQRVPGALLLKQMSQQEPQFDPLPQKPPEQTRNNPKPFLKRHKTEDQICEFQLLNTCDMYCAK